MLIVLPYVSMSMSGATVGHGSSRTTHHVYHDWNGDDPVGRTIVDAIATYENTRSSELPALERSINPDALDYLFESTGDDAPNGGTLSFSYAGYVVLVMSTGQILIRKPPEG
jgi:hypothetical protein